MRVRRTHRATQDIATLLRFLRDYDRRSARRFAYRLHEAFRRLAMHPYSGSEQPALGEGVRRTVVGLSIVFYRIEPEAVVILRVVDGRMDLLPDMFAP